MGMQQSIPFAAPPAWPSIAERLKARGFDFKIRMIDNLPAFPDEVPEEGWQEIRLSSSNGMMTLRRTDAGLDCVVWGNAEGGLHSDWKRLNEILTEHATEASS